MKSLNNVNKEITTDKYLFYINWFLPVRSFVFTWKLSLVRYIHINESECFVNFLCMENYNWQLKIWIQLLETDTWIHTFIK